MGYYSYNYNELYHHGIKGQKWGVRRFQNPDGSLTAKGEKRYNDGGRSIMSNQKIKKPGFVNDRLTPNIDSQKYIKGGTTPIGSKLRKGAGVVKNKISDKHAEKNAEEKSEKKGLSKKQKVAIGVGIAGVAAVGAYAAGVKIADVKANKAANEKISKLISKANVDIDVARSNLESSTYLADQALGGDKREKAGRIKGALDLARDRGDRYSKTESEINRMIKYGGRKNKSVKLNKKNAARLNYLKSQRSFLDNDIEYAIRAGEKIKRNK